MDLCCIIFHDLECLFKSWNWNKWLIIACKVSLCYKNNLYGNFKIVSSYLIQVKQTVPQRHFWKNFTPRIADRQLKVAHGLCRTQFWKTHVGQHILDFGKSFSVCSLLLIRQQDKRHWETDTGLELDIYDEDLKNRKRVDIFFSLFSVVTNITCFHNLGDILKVPSRKTPWLFCINVKV